MAFRFPVNGSYSFFYKADGQTGVQRLSGVHTAHDVGRHRTTQRHRTKVVRYRAQCEHRFSAAS